MTWDDDRRGWTVRFDDGSSDECEVVVSAVGFLNVARYPDWPGLDDFAGPKFHTARFEHEHDLTGKVVAVVGTGSSATQIVPALWPLVQKLYRPGTKTNEARRQFCLGYIARQFAERPDLREAVTPTSPYPGKRPLFASTFYPALKQENVELVPRAVASVTRDGLVDADGVERAVDVTAVEVKPSFEARWYRRLQSAMEGTSWTMSNNYFKAANGKIVTQWPYGNTQYRVLTKVLGRVSEITRRRAD